MNILDSYPHGIQRHLAGPRLRNQDMQAPPLFIDGSNNLNEGDLIGIDGVLVWGEYDYCGHATFVDLAFLVLHLDGIQRNCKLC